MKTSALCRKSVCLLIIIMIAFLALSGCADKNTKPSGESQNPADSVMKITFSSVKQQHQIAGKALIDMADRVNKSLAGKVEATAYCGGELYDGTQELQALLNQDAHLLIVFGARMESLDPRFQVFKMPFLFPDPKTACDVLDGPTGDKVWSMAEEKGVKVIGFAPEGYIAIGNNRGPLKLPKDFEGLKLRVPGRIDTAIIEALGGSAIAIEPTETYTALQQRVIDGIFCPDNVFFDNRYYEVQDYVTNAELLYLPLSVVIVNEEWWTGLPSDIRDEIQKCVDETVEWWRNDSYAIFDTTAQRIADKGPEVHTLTPAEKDAWREATKSVYSLFSSNLEPGMLEMIQEAVKTATSK